MKKKGHIYYKTAPKWVKISRYLIYLTTNKNLKFCQNLAIFFHICTISAKSMFQKIVVNFLYVNFEHIVFFFAQILGV